MNFFNLNIRFFIRKSLRKSGQLSFVNNLGFSPNILDVGCGKSVFAFKSVRPDCFYTGIDIEDYEQNKYFMEMIDNYIFTTPENFSEAIDCLAVEFDAVISCHNLEHTFYPEKVLESMLKKVKRGGSLYLSFPSAKSLSFPSRIGTLNYYDDITHNNEPPDLENIIEILKKNGYSIDLCIKEYRPLFLSILGFFLEPFSSFSGKLMPGIWEYYGFESIIHASRK